MTDLNCSACEELRQTAPDFVVNGLSDDNCASLGNGTGLNPSNENDNCTDLDNINDCLIGNMATEVEAYDVCDWKEFMKNFIPNLWTTLKAIICAICGVWRQLSRIKEISERLECLMEYMTAGVSFSFGENTAGKVSRIVPGKGVEFSMVGSTESSSDITLIYVGGALAYITGSVQTFVESYKDGDQETQPGNDVWDFLSNGWTLPYGGELLYEIRIKKSEYPMIKRFFRGDGWNNAGGQNFYQVGFFAFDGDTHEEGATVRYAFGQHGACSQKDGTPHSSGYSEGHVVHEGYIYLQCRMIYVAHQPVRNDIEDGAGIERRGSQFTPHGYMGIRINSDALDC